eukprot:366226-Chlamydomonas_euryale.AAC.29
MSESQSNKDHVPATALHVEKNSHTALARSGCYVDTCCRRSAPFPELSTPPVTAPCSASLVTRPCSTPVVPRCRQLLVCNLPFTPARPSFVPPRLPSLIPDTLPRPPHTVPPTLRRELALYCASRALESGFRCLAQWGVLDGLAPLLPPRLDAIMFSLGVAAIVNSYSGDHGQHRDVFRSKYLNILDFVFGGAGVGKGEIHHLPSNRDLVVAAAQRMRAVASFGRLH